MLRRLVVFSYVVLAVGLTVAVSRAEDPHVKDGQPVRREDPVCRLVDLRGAKPLLEGKLSPFWAQDYIGADLAKQSIRDWEKAKGVSLEPVPIGISDGGISPEHLTGPISPHVRAMIGTKVTKTLNGGPGHGTAVGNLINGKDTGVSEKAILSGFFINEGRTSEMADSAKYWAENGARIINESVSGLGDRLGRDQLHQARAALYKKLASGALFVTISGNRYPFPTDRERVLSGAILVGNMAVNGLTYPTAQEDEGVVVSAPSDNYLTSKKTDEPTAPFGGTSGTAPQVSGALANVLAFLPKLTSDEAKTLLRKTAVPTAFSRQRPQKNGAGMLNALKLVEVAKRLREKGFNDLKPEARAKLLGDETIFRFSTEKQWEEAQALLKDPDCKKQAKGADLARTVLLLTAGTPDTKIFEEACKALVAVYEKEKFTWNAEFYRSLSGEELPGVIARAAEDAEEDRRGSAWRSAPLLSKDAAAKLLLKGLKDERRDNRMVAVEATRELGAEAALPILAEALKWPDDNAVWRQVFTVYARLGEQGAAEVKKHFDSGDEQLRDYAVRYAAAALPWKYAGPILTAALRDPKLKRGAFFAHGSFPDAALPLIEEAWKGNVESRTSAVALAGNIGPKGMPYLVAALKGKAKEPALAAMDAGERMGEERLALIQLALYHPDSEVRRWKAMDALLDHWKAGYSLAKLSKDDIDRIEAIADMKEGDTQGYLLSDVVAPKIKALVKELRAK